MSLEVGERMTEEEGEEGSGEGGDVDGIFSHQSSTFFVSAAKGRKREKKVDDDD